MKILLIKGQSRYGALRKYLDEFAMCLKELGDEVFMIDALKENAEKELIDLISREGHFDFLLSCNAMFVESFVSELHKYIDYYASYVTDHPSTHFQRISQANDRCLLFMIDEMHLRFAKTYFTNGSRMSFVPLSGSVFKNRIPFSEKENRLVFTGSYAKAQKIFDDNTAGLSENMISFTSMIINYVVQNCDKTVEEAIDYVLAALGVEASNDERFMMCVQMGWINSYLEMYFRDLVIRKIVESGIQIHIFGSGWEDFESNGKSNMIFHDFNSEDSLEFVSRSTISLNVMPWFRAGFQERIGNAMLNGTMAVTDTTRYIEREFLDGENLVSFELNDLDAMIDKLKFYLGDKDAACMVADLGYELATKGHSWMERVKVMRVHMNEMINQQ